VNLREQYKEERFALLPLLLSDVTVGRLRRATCGLPSRRVTVRSHEHTEWDELDVSSRRELTRVFLTEPAVAVVLDALGRRHVADDDVVCWANRYGVGERIAPHRDAAGTVQLLICLTAPASEASGGILHLSTRVGTRALRLMPGDGVLWDATAIEHWTTSLVATLDEPRPERVVLVGRYFL
jgi:alkylated DNA repair dioxygenase AlkB